eukprot:scaffold1056_cov564-Prasinococcus_capsulatus_cf.AAC.19
MPFRLPRSSAAPDTWHPALRPAVPLRHRWTTTTTNAHPPGPNERRRGSGAPPAKKRRRRERGGKIPTAHAAAFWAPLGRRCWPLRGPSSCVLRLARSAPGQEAGCAASASPLPRGCPGSAGAASGHPSPHGRRALAGERPRCVHGRARPRAAVARLIFPPRPPGHPRMPPSIHAWCARRAEGTSGQGGERHWEGWGWGRTGRRWSVGSRAPWRREKAPPVPALSHESRAPAGGPLQTWRSTGWPPCSGPLRATHPSI